MIIIIIFRFAMKYDYNYNYILHQMYKTLTIIEVNISSW